jgi:capsular polysaccharide transport system permease protein
MGPDDQSRSIVRSALDHARLVSEELADAARRARYSSRSRKALVKGGFQGRRHARLMSLLIQVSFILLVVAPTLSATVYYTLIASDQYVAEARFTVAGGEMPRSDSFGSMSGIPAAAIIQDMQIVVSFLESRTAVEQLDSAVGLKALYTRDDIDPISRFKADAPIEKLVKYWRRMSDASIKMPSGIIEFKARAFSPEDAREIAAAVLRISEQLINDINARMLADTVRGSKIELERAAKRLSEARVSLEKTRNEEGILDAARAGESLSKLLTDARGALISLKEDYAIHSARVSDTAPQMRVLKSRIDATNNEIAELEAKMTTVSFIGPEGRTLSSSMTKFAELDLEHRIAEKLYAGAAASLELAQLSAERKLMYINTFVKPVLPEEPQYPRRGLYPALVALGSLAIWGALMGLGSLARNHMA